MGIFRTLLLGDIGNYLDNEDLKTEHKKTAHRLRKKESKDRKQDIEIDELQKENVELKYTLSALIKILFEKGLIEKDDLHSLSEIENLIEEGEIEHDAIWKKFNQ